ncbi:MAG TPA: MotA/TolQ/ExbB proton channel family protein [Gemmataceae bacterium]|nr:MotA/TolQ/ExbB proton channel family protein [Gemmataceae bacterium]
MNRKATADKSVTEPGVRHSNSTIMAFVVGVPLAVGILKLFLSGPLQTLPIARYVHHTVEWVEVLLFCCAISALGAKLWHARRERAVFRLDLLPRWDGSPQPVATATTLTERLRHLPARLRNTFLVQRLNNVLDFLGKRGSANDLDDQLRALTENDVIAHEGSFALTRFITWAIPILGFLGTVLGITASIAGVTPESLEKNLNQVTDGLALAFDATALGLALTMVVMFCSFLVERAEQSVLERVDRYVEQELAHRFERSETEGGDFVAVLRQNTNVLVKATGELVERQAAVWAQALEQAERRRLEAEERQQKRTTAALEAALEKTLEAYNRRLAGLEKQVVDQSASLVERMAALSASAREAGREQLTALKQMAQGVQGQVEVLGRLQENEAHLVRLQEVLHQNLAALSGAGAFEAAVQSLTAAIHLLTTRVTGPASADPAKRLPRPGAAA